MQIKGLLIDIGGVLYVGEKPISGAIDTINLLRKTLSLRFLTNTTRKPPKAVLKKMENMGFSIKEEELFTALKALRDFIEEKNKKAIAILTDEAMEYLKPLLTSGKEAKFVVIGDAGENFNYKRLNLAFRALINKASLIAAAKNRYFKDEDGELSMDAGGFVKALEYAAETEAKILGKPSKDFFEIAVKSMNLKKDEVLMIGDDIENDIQGALNAGIKAVLVKSGKFRESDLKKGITPTAIIEDITHLPKILKDI